MNLLTYQILKILSGRRKRYPLIIANHNNRERIRNALILLSEVDPTAYEFVLKHIKVIWRADYFGFHCWLKMGVVDRKEMKSQLRLACALYHLAVHLCSESEDETLPNQYEWELYTESFGMELEEC